MWAAPGLVTWQHTCLDNTMMTQLTRVALEQHHGDAVLVTLEGLDTGALLVAFPKLRDVKEPRLGRLVERGGEDEVTREKDPGVGRRH